MEYKQFIELMEQRVVADKESASLLHEFLIAFPYCQTAQLLLAKTLHDRQHVGYEKQLKIAAAYAVDRKILYRLMHASPEVKEIQPEDITTTRPDSPFVIAPAAAEIPAGKNGEKKTGTIPLLSNPFAEIPDTESVVEMPEATASPAYATQEAIPEPGSAEQDFQEDDLSTSEMEGRDTISPVLHEWVNDSDLQVEEEEEINPDKKSDPHEVIRRRLSEIMNLSGAAPAEVKPEAAKAPEKPEGPVTREIPVVPADSIPTKAEEPVPGEISSVEIDISGVEQDLAKDPIGRIELEHALEESILGSIEKLPLIEKNVPEKQLTKIVEIEQVPEESGDEAGPRDFMAWIRQTGTGKFGMVEEVHAEETKSTIIIEEERQEVVVTDSGPEIIETPPVTKSKEQSSSKDELINKFIETEPRIVPSRVEFYSPANQAKKSVTEDDELISETLARIYMDQGHFLKARAGFQRLSLLHPEKSVYFAALIKEIDDKLNNPTKEDL